MKNFIYIFIIYLLLINKSTAQPINPNLSYVIIDSIKHFNESTWRRNVEKTNIAITVFNHSFTYKYVTALNDTISKNYIFSLFILPNKQYTFPNWTLANYDSIKNNIISYNKMQNIILQTIGQAKQFPSHTAMVYRIKPVIVKNGEYYVTRNTVIGQCWEVIDKKITEPEEANSSTINTFARIFSKEEIEERRKKELKKMQNESNSIYPLGWNNIFADLVFLNTIDSKNKIYHYWYKPAETFDGNHWNDGITEFLYSPCIGIIGGTFSSYFNWLLIDPKTMRPTKFSYGGFYKADTINNVPIQTYLQQKCKP